MAKSRNITLFQYLALVERGYDGESIRRWTKRHAANELAKPQLPAKLAAEQSVSTKKQDKARKKRIRGGLPKLTSPVVVAIPDAICAGLDHQAATVLAATSASCPEPLDIPMEEREPIKRVCLDVLAVIGLGQVDRLLLNHFIRDVLRRLLDKYRPESSLPITERLCHLFARPHFVEEAIAALAEHVGASLRGRTSPERLKASQRLTESWIRNGGWKAYWFAIAVIRALQPRFKASQCEPSTPDGALSVAFGYTSVTRDVILEKK